MKRLSGGLLAFALLTLGANAVQAAGLIKCVDDKGVTHYGDKMPEQCLGHASEELSKRGVVIKKTERPPTAEELQAKEVDAAQRKVEAQKQAEQKRRDVALLLSYTSEKEIDAARVREVQRVEGQIANAKSMQSKQASESQKKRVDTMVEASRKELDEINARYDAYKARYIELKKAEKVGKL